MKSQEARKLVRKARFAEKPLGITLVDTVINSATGQSVERYRRTIGVPAPGYSMTPASYFSLFALLGGGALAAAIITDKGSSIEEKFGASALLSIVGYTMLPTTAESPNWITTNNTRPAMSAGFQQRVASIGPS
jgi:hypothetical protein